MRESIKKLSEIVLGEREISKIGSNFLALLCLGIAVAISFKEFADPSAGFFSKSKTLTFMPDFISSIIGLILLMPLYGRRLINWNKSIYSILYFILAAALFGTMAELALFGGNQSNVTTGLIAISLILSWFGLREIAGFSWIFCFAATIINVVLNNIALGFYGYLYVIFGFLGVLLNTNLTPAELIQALKEEYSGIAHSSAANRIQNDVELAQDRVQGTVAQVKEAIKNR